MKIYICVCVCSWIEILIIVKMSVFSKLTIRGRARLLTARYIAVKTKNTFRRATGLTTVVTATWCSMA